MPRYLGRLGHTQKLSRLLSSLFSTRSTLIRPRNSPPLLNSTPRTRFSVLVIVHADLGYLFSSGYIKVFFSVFERKCHFLKVCCLDITSFSTSTCLLLHRESVLPKKGVNRLVEVVSCPFTAKHHTFFQKSISFSVPAHQRSFPIPFSDNQTADNFPIDSLYLTIHLTNLDLPLRSHQAGRHLSSTQPSRPSTSNSRAKQRIATATDSQRIRIAPVLGSECPLSTLILHFTSSNPVGLILHYYRHIVIHLSLSASVFSSETEK